jgi:diadenosine tetraphosphatase ApaH/serine/threonine PP2A family protein phosphatase
LRENEIDCVRGNYDDSIGRGLADCQCGYTDPRDNHFAQISYEYTLANTSDANRAWLRTLPGEIRFDLSPYRVLLCHGSPRRMNEFLWESTTPTHFLDQLAEQHQTDVVCGTHTGIKWQRDLAGGKRFVNVGVLGRPENDGRANVWYTLLIVGGTRRGRSSPQSRVHPCRSNDHHRLGNAGRESLPRVHRNDPHRLVDDLPGRRCLKRATRVSTEWPCSRLAPFCSDRSSQGR